MSGMRVPDPLPGRYRDGHYDTCAIRADAPCDCPASDPGLPLTTGEGTRCPECGGVPDPCAECGRLREQLDAARREADAQMQAKLDAQVTLRAVTEALDLRFDELGDGWREAAPKILARIETIVDEADRAFRERDALRGVSNAYGCFAGCTGALAGAPADGSGHTPACRAARAALGVERAR